ncbi:MarR family transcriptional regulator [Mycolicibacterium sp. BiH015]|uniref:MarR family winged helix-turn-helix transcriptional regulator n=1 Tax=Mycolicibacterium sp. BiH015 TaxID=3018808 RepID=UPI0022E78114|nr:MarR family transcriptional regulator [Mycolicibacterium sp. BiH015]MDA2893447.1 MarR family transcriptional regulator [Mycolicibacterium sp. BiH015]
MVDELTRQLMSKHQLAIEWFDTLAHLAAAPDGRLSQRALRERFILSQSGVSRMLARMEHVGLIDRKSCDDDRRAVLITITEYGRFKLVGAIESHINTIGASFTDEFTNTDRKALTLILHKLCA